MINYESPNFRETRDIESQTLLKENRRSNIRYGDIVYKTILIGMVGVTTFYTVYTYYYCA